VPYAYAVVQLDEGPRLVSNMVHDTRTESGQAVEVALDESRRSGLW
jgi:uncharacterized OB-fold protein